MTTNQHTSPEARRVTSQAGAWTEISYDLASDTYRVTGWAPFFIDTLDDEPEGGVVLNTTRNRGEAVGFARGFRAAADAAERRA